MAYTWPLGFTEVLKCYYNIFIRFVSLQYILHYKNTLFVSISTQNGGCKKFAGKDGFAIWLPVDLENAGIGGGDVENGYCVENEYFVDNGRNVVGVNTNLNGGNLGRTILVSANDAAIKYSMEIICN